MSSFPSFITNQNSLLFFVSQLFVYLKKYAFVFFNNYFDSSFVKLISTFGAVFGIKAP